MNLRPRAALVGFTPGCAFDNRDDAPRGYLNEPGKLPVVKQIYDLKSPRNQTKSENSLGAGAYGVVCRTTNGVVKFDKSGSEARLYALLPERLRSLSILPQRSKTGSLRLPTSWPSIHHNQWIPTTRKVKRIKISVIEREELDNLVDFSTKTTRLTELGFGVVSRAIDACPSLTPHETRNSVFRGVLKWIKENEQFNLTPEEKKQLKHFGLSFLRLVRFGIIPRDMQARNMGQRSDGSLVLRDLGVYIVLDDTLAKKTEDRCDKRRPENVSSVVKRLRAMKEASGEQ